MATGAAPRAPGELTASPIESAGFRSWSSGKIKMDAGRRGEWEERVKEKDEKGREGERKEKRKGKGIYICFGLIIVNCNVDQFFFLRDIHSKTKVIYFEQGFVA